MSPKRGAAIDIGTNCVLMSVQGVECESQAPEHWSFDEHYSITRLGEGVDSSGELLPSAVRRTLQALRRYRAHLDQAGVEKLYVAGTSALRDASGSQAFLAAARDILNADINIISGEREAQLTFAGACLGLQPSRRTRVAFDIGGGSTEVITASDASMESVSLQLGSVRMTERCPLSDPPHKEELRQLKVEIAAALENAQLEKLLGDADDYSKREVIGIAGTVTTLFAISHQLKVYEPHLVHGQQLTLEEVRQVVRVLQSLSKEQRLKLPGLQAGREDLVVAGALICQQLLERLGATSCTVSDRGVRHGLLLEAHDREPRRDL